MDWQDELNRLKGQKLLLVGIGNRLRMDDAIGVIIAENLIIHVEKTQTKRLLLIYSGGLTPEDCIDIAMNEKPAAVVMIDACDCHLQPGAIVILPETDLPDCFHTTHSISPKVIGYMIQKFAGSQVFYLGIQVAEVGFEEWVSEPVGAAGAKVVEYFKEWM